MSFVKINSVDRIVNKDFIYLKMENNTETLTINKPGRVLHFCDGVDEEIVEEEAAELATEPQESNNVDPKTLPWGPWFSHYAWKSGNKMLNAVDSAGESLSAFFGITTPKYQIEIDEYESLKEEKRKIEEESAGWVPKNAGGDVPLVLNEPMKDLDKPAEV